MRKIRAILSRPLETPVRAAVVSLLLVSAPRLAAAICNQPPPVEIDFVRFRQQNVRTGINGEVHEFLTSAGSSADLTGEWWGGPFSGSAQVTVPQTLRGTFRGRAIDGNLDYLVRMAEPVTVSASASGSYARTTRFTGSFLEIGFSGPCFPADWDPSWNVREDVPAEGESASFSHAASCTAESSTASRGRWRFGSQAEWPDTGDAFDEVAIEVDVFGPGAQVAFFAVYRVPRSVTCVEVISNGSPRSDNSVSLGETVTLRLQGAAIGDATAVDLGAGIEATVVADGFFGGSADSLHVDISVGCLADAGPRPIKITTPRGVVDGAEDVAITVKDALSTARSAARTAGATTCPADIVEVRSEVPARGSEIEEGQDQAFRATAVYTLNTRSTAEIDLELRDQRNDLVGVSAFAPAPGGTRRAVTLNIAEVEIPLGTTRLLLRARIVHEGRVVVRSTPVEYAVSAERNVRIVPTGSTVFAGEDLPVDLEILDNDGRVVSSFNGDVEIELVAPGTVDVGALKLPGAGASTSVKATVPIAGGRGQVILQTPREELTTKSVITPKTVLEGSAVLEARVKGRERTTVEQVRVESPLDLWIDRIEVQQAVADPNVSDLVRFRPVIVRMYVEANKGEFSKYDRIDGISASVRVVNGLGNDSTETATKGGFVNSHRPNQPFSFERQPRPEILREYPNTGGDTLNIVVPADGDLLSIFAEIDDVFPERDPANNRKDVGPLRVRSSREITIQIGRAVWDAANGRSTIPTLAGIARSKRMLAALYPISDGKLRFVSRPQETFDSWPPFEIRLNRRLNRLFGSSIDSLVFFVDEKFFRLAGKEPPGKRLYGTHFSALPMAFVASTYCITENHCGVLAHELGHAFGLEDTYRFKTETSPAYPGNLVEVGSFDGFTLNGPSDSIRGPFISAQDQVVEFMGNSAEPWVDVPTWNTLREKFEMTAGARKSVSGLATGPSLFVQGSLHLDGSGVLDVCYVFEDGERSTGDVGGNATIETVNAAGAVLDEFVFEATIPVGEEAFELADEGVFPFGFSLPFSDEVREIRLRLDGGLVATRQVSANRPEIALDPVPGPRPLQGTRSISWTGSDVDGDQLVYSLYYSPDGAMQIPLLSESTVTDFSWDTDQSPSGPAPVLTLVATDRVRSKIVLSEVLPMANRAPRVVITTPANDAAFEVGTPVTLEADLSDMEDEYSLSPALEWSSDRQGDLGAGWSLSADRLLAGRHVVTCSGTDSEGEGGSDSVILNMTVRCAGDCDRSGNVAVNELIRGVGISLGTVDFWACPAFDVDGNATVQINELIRAVSSALTGCPAPPATATATATAEASPTLPPQATATLAASPTTARDTPTPMATEVPAATATSTLRPTEPTAAPSPVPTLPPTPAPTPTVVACCPTGPLLVAGSEWYLSCPGESCDQTCAKRGGLSCDESATSDFAGSTGSDANCELLLFGFGVDAPVFEAACVGGVGCFHDTGFGGTFRCVSPKTTCGAIEFEQDERVCACIDG